MFSEIKFCFQLITGVFSLLTNSISICLVITHSPNKLGNYKYLMCYFSAISMIYAILDYTVQPFIHVHGSSFAMFMDLRDSIFEGYPTVAFFLVASLTGCFGLTIYSIAINFIYRFFAIQREGGLRYFAGKRVVLWMLIPGLAGIVWVSNNWFRLGPNRELSEYLRSTIKEEYDLDIDKTTYTGCLYWRTGPNGTSILSYNDLLGALGLSNLMMIPFSIIVYFGYKNCSRIKIVLSQGECEYSKKLQMQLYKALVVQTLIPMIFLFFPIGFFFTCPLIGVDIEWASVLITFLYSFYPAVDPIPTLYFVDDYRNGFFNFFRRLLSKNQVASVVSYDGYTDHI